ncbi:MAG TPA: hypothetical protein VHC86_10760 [Opitutaceae bacterium]|nr:hypothetical protein [Opitutaceae bacterium]
MDITPAELKQAIEREDDFGHEMRIRKLLGRIPYLRYEHGGAYSDPFEEKPREYDFRCFVRGKQADRRLSLAIEGKNLDPDAPLIISGTSRVARESFHEWIASGYSGRMPYSVVKKRDKVDRLYPAGQFVGKSILRLKPNPEKKGEKLIRARNDERDLSTQWKQALTSAHDLCTKAALALQEVPVGHSQPILTMVLPILAVPDGSLWRMSYTEDGIGGGAPETVDSIQYFVGWRVDGRTDWNTYSVHLTHLHFVTMTGLANLLGSMHATSDIWEDWFSQEPPA